MTKMTHIPVHHAIWKSPASDMSGIKIVVKIKMTVKSSRETIDVITRANVLSMMLAVATAIRIVAKKNKNCVFGKTMDVITRAHVLIIIYAVTSEAMRIVANQNKDVKFRRQTKNVITKVNVLIIIYAVTTEAIRIVATKNHFVNFRRQTKNVITKVTVIGFKTLGNAACSMMAISIVVNSGLGLP